MSKYNPLTNYLKTNQSSSIAMTFLEIENIIGRKLPESRKYNAWWSNNPTNNVMTKAWLEAGYRTEQVDPARERVVFVRNNTVAPPATTSTPRNGRHPAWGALKGTSNIEVGFDLTAPVDESWSSVYDK